MLSVPMIKRLPACDLMDRLTHTCISLLLVVVDICHGEFQSGGNILVLSYPGTSYLHRTAYLAEELKLLRYNTTFVMPDGPVKEMFIKKFDMDVIVSDGLTKSMKLIVDGTETLVSNGFNGSTLAWFGLTKHGENICKNLLLDHKLFDNLRKRNFRIAILNGAVMNLCFSVIPYRLSIPFIRQEFVVIDIGSVLHPAVFPVNYFQPTSDKMTFLQRLGNTLFYVFLLTTPDAINPKDVVRTFVPDKPYISNAGLKAETSLYLLDIDELVDYHFPAYPNMIAVGGLSTRPALPLKGQLNTFMDSAVSGAIIVALGSNIKSLPKHIQDKLMIAFRQLENLKFIVQYGEAHLVVNGNVMFLPWSPQNDLLGHRNTRVFVTHCGINAQFEALFHGVPIVGIPVFGDQYYNAAKMQAKGFGIVLGISDFTAEELIFAIERLMNTTTYKDKISKASKIFKSRHFTPAQRAAWWVDHVIKYGGEHLRPPLAHLPYYQFLMLDVVIGISIILTFSVFTCYFSVKCVYRCCCKRKAKLD